MRRRHRRGITLVEMLVVIAIIGVLVALLLPAIQMARESTRRTQCLNNLKQSALAVQNFQEAKTLYPPSMRWNYVIGSTINDWSVWARVTPYLEESALGGHVLNTDGEGETMVNGMLLTAYRVSNYVCPSDPNQMLKVDPTTGAPAGYPVNYGVNQGTWLTFDPDLKKTPPGAFYPNSALAPKHFTDGLSKTLMAAEVKMWTPYYNKGSLSSTPPAAPGVVCSSGYSGKIGPSLVNNTGHTEWADGGCWHTGMTTTFTPNTPVICNFAGAVVDVDYVSRNENSSATKNTYAALTSRSYHSGLVNVAMMDGSAHVVADTIDLITWQALSTRAGGEEVTEDF